MLLTSQTASIHLAGVFTPGTLTLALQTHTASSPTPFYLHVGDGGKKFEFFDQSIGSGREGWMKAGPTGDILVPEAAIKYITDANGKTIWTDQAGFVIGPSNVPPKPHSRPTRTGPPPPPGRPARIP